MKINRTIKKIVDKLLLQNDYITAKIISEDTNVSVRTIIRQLNLIEKLLAKYNLHLERKRGKGLYVIGKQIDKEKIKKALKDNIYYEYTPEERRNVILSQLLKTQKPIKLISLAILLNVTEATISNDLDKLEEWTKRNNINLVRKQGMGIYLNGMEKNIRKAIVNFIYEHIHEKDALDFFIGTNDIINKSNEFLLALLNKEVVQKTETAIKNIMKKENYKLSLNSFSGLVVHLSLAVQRLIDGEKIVINKKFLKEIQGKKEFSIAKKIGLSIENEFNIKVIDEELAYITMHLLGARNNYQQFLNQEYSDFYLRKTVKQMIAIAEKETDIVLSIRHEFLTGLVNHLGVAIIRIKLKMKIRNPLLEQMKEQYPEWMDLMRKSIVPLEKNFNIKLPEEEIGYIAMHLGAAISEKINLNERIFNVIVACATGIGTSKLLVAQLKKEFNNLNIVTTVSALDIDYDLNKQENIDFIISTVEIEKAKLPVVVVNYILKSEDKYCIMQQMKRSILIKLKSKKQIKTTKSSFLEKLSKLKIYLTNIENILNNFFFKQGISDVENVNQLCLIVGNCLFKDERKYILCVNLKHRENKGSTIFNNILILHAKTSLIIAPMIGVIQFENIYNIDTIDGKKQVKTVLVLLIPEKSNREIREIVGYISEVLVNDLNLLDILQKGSFDDIYKKIEEVYSIFFNKKYSILMYDFNK